MTKPHSYLRLKKKRAADIPALDRLVRVFGRYCRLEETGDVHQQIYDIISTLVGGPRIVEGGHKWWVLMSPDPRLWNLLSILADLDAYDVFVEEKQ